jgi:hypothetical protein
MEISPRPEPLSASCFAKVAHDTSAGRAEGMAERHAATLGI